MYCRDGIHTQYYVFVGRKVHIPVLIQAIEGEPLKAPAPLGQDNKNPPQSCQDAFLAIFHV